MSENQIIANIRQEINRRIVDEGISRIIICLSHLSEDQIWHKLSDKSNSVGNLILHLNGNVRQWLFSAMADVNDNRNREAEFSDHKTLTKNKLLDLLGVFKKDTFAFCQSLEFEQLTESYQVQGYTETGLSMVIHVIEHFSYHVGQITYFTKYVNNVDVEYYGDKDLDVLNSRTKYE